MGYDVPVLEARVTGVLIGRVMPGSLRAGRWSVCGIDSIRLHVETEIGVKIVNVRTVDCVRGCHRAKACGCEREGM